jgi:hypothetical protein
MIGPAWVALSDEAGRLVVAAKAGLAAVPMAVTARLAAPAVAAP